MGDFLKVDIDLYNFEDSWTPKYIALKAMPYKPKYHLTKHGIHILIESLPNNIELRRYFMDCPHRLAMDEERERRGLPTNVLFVAKNGRKVEETEKIEVVLNWITIKWRERKKRHMK